MKEKIKVLLPEAEVDKKIQELGEQISKDYEGKSIHMICVLKGGVFFTCELAKRISVPVSLDFMTVSSYGNGTTSSGAVRIVKDLDEPLDGKDVLIVEDIIDSGNTLHYLVEILYKRKPNSMRLLRKMWTKSCSMRSVMCEPALQHAQACRRTLSFPTQRSLIWLQNSHRASSICCPSAA